MARIVCFGEILIRLSAPGRELMLQTPRLDTYAGGAEANVAVSLARFGHEARMASILPDNALAHGALAELRRWNVDTRSVLTGAGRLGLYFLTSGAGLRPSDVLYDRAQSAFALAAPDAIDWSAALEGADWLHVSGVTPAVSANAADAAHRAMKAARAAGVRVSYDANFRAKLWEARGGDPTATLDALFAEADLAFAEARDLSLLTGHRIDSDEAAAKIAFERYPNLQRLASTARKVISADHHELSAVSFTRTGATRTRTHTITGIVDRIGGGDAFAAGVLHGLVSGAGEQAMLDFALAAACLKHYIPGDFNLSTAADVQFYLSNSGSDVRR
ncbi:MAG TPA: sugar kinase [Vitreimonas sp.]|uniref:sugar kinase n=1 Tax=Vitreimonas sp. TaxID=3069702 RepID=UPI002D46213D|nr:sugar kinase [Vitreimonas sp.]HYD89824.1 sugar kinase [Vitreimonas sp.]